MMRAVSEKRINNYFGLISCFPRSLACRGKADICFVVDGSSSIRLSNVAGVDNWKLLLDFIINLVNLLPIGEQESHLGVVSFSNNANIEFGLDEHFTKAALINAIRNIPYQDGWTNTSAGIYEMINNCFDPTQRGQRGDRSNVINIGVVITDGASNYNRTYTIPNADKAKRNGIHMLAVGITRAVNVQELRGISSSGIEGDTLFTSPDFNVTSRVIDNIIKEACTKAGIPEGMDKLCKLTT